MSTEIIYTLRHKPTGKYVSKAKRYGYNPNYLDGGRVLTELKNACFWGSESLAKSSLRQRENPEEWEIVKFNLTEVL